MTVTVRDHGAAKMVNLSAEHGSVKVGIMAGKGATVEKGGITVLQVGTFHEFGLGVPERSFIRAWFDGNLPEIKKTLADLVDDVDSPAEFEQMLEIFGLWAVGQIQQRIADGIEPPLKEATIRRKGSSTPLIDTGQLRSSITHEVEHG